MNTQTVFVVDDAREVRISLSRLLTVRGYTVSSFESAEQFLRDQDFDAPGCVLLDLAMPGMSGLDVQRALHDSMSPRPIVFLTGQGDIHASVHAMKAGAVDFLVKPVDDSRLVAAVDRALRIDAANRRTRAIRGMIERRLRLLTLREREVMNEVVFGRLNKQIAAKLGIGEKTVKVHRAHVMSKMGARSVAELVSLAARVDVAMEPALCASVTDRHRGAGDDRRNGSTHTPAVCHEGDRNQGRQPRPLGGGWRSPEERLSS
jgi:FixJ family two-component response regulator